MDERFRDETDRLIRSWRKHDPRVLRDYLVHDVEDPRINVQSVLTRHFLVERLFGGRFAALRDHELRFAAVMNWLLATLRPPEARQLHDDLLRALLDGDDPPAGIDVPAFVTETFAALPAQADGLDVDDYITDVLVKPPAPPTEPPLDEYVLSSFQTLWRAALAAPTAAARPLP